ncbi:MAG: hypothetical protein HQL57_00535 [Magnetococcales bacterium]|nr:hypothetical protein [Magnetococcales bacterium]MBF0155657.1 hypothetical protein [Magnetococcales bacterium]
MPRPTLLQTPLAGVVPELSRYCTTEQIRCRHPKLQAVVLAIQRNPGTALYRSDEAIQLDAVPTSADDPLRKGYPRHHDRRILLLPVSSTRPGPDRKCHETLSLWRLVAALDRGSNGSRSTLP